MSMNTISFYVQSVEELMKSPFAKFITFSANDCGYSGSTKGLIVNWVHALLLKAKAAASKEDNPTWWEAMHGLFADEYWTAAITEIETLVAMNVWDAVNCTEGMNVLQSTWAFKLKNILMDLLEHSKPVFLQGEINRSRELISFKHILLLFHGKPFL